VSEPRPIYMMAEEGGERAQTTIDQIEVGRDLGELEWSVTRPQVEGLIASDEEFDPWHADIGEGGGVVPILATYPPVRALFARSFNIRGFLYQYECEFLRPIAYGQSLTIRGWITDKWVKRNREYVKFEAEARDAEGTIVFRTSRTHLLDYRPSSPTENAVEVVDV
jgi:hypothetical protein